MTQYGRIAKNVGFWLWILYKEKYLKFWKIQLILSTNKMTLTTRKFETSDVDVTVL